jgi:hypothetical protein
MTVTFTELGASAISRGEKGTVALIVRDGADLEPLSLSQSSQVPKTLGTQTQDYIKRTFVGYTSPPKRVLVYVIPSEGDEGLDDALDWLATQDFDYLCGPADCTADEAAAIADWVKGQRANNGAKYKAVLPNYPGDHYAVINFTGAGLVAGTQSYTTAEYCSRIAGLIAGTPMKISATYAPLTELTDANRLTREELDEAVGRGELALKWDGKKFKLARGVNSLVTTSDGILDSFKKIKIVEIMDLIRTDLAATAEDTYIGKFANTYDNKLLLITAVRSYFAQLAQDDLVQSGYTVDLDLDAQERYLASQGSDVSALSEQEVRQADTGTHVFLRIACKILDAMEDIDINITI